MTVAEEENVDSSSTPHQQDDKPEPEPEQAHQDGGSLLLDSRNVVQQQDATDNKIGAADASDETLKVEETNSVACS